MTSPSDRGTVEGADDIDVRWGGNDIHCKRGYVTLADLNGDSQARLFACRVAAGGPNEEGDPLPASGGAATSLVADFGPPALAQDAAKPWTGLYVGGAWGRTEARTTITIGTGTDRRWEQLSKSKAREEGPPLRMPQSLRRKAKITYQKMAAARARHETTALMTIQWLRPDRASRSRRRFSLIAITYLVLIGVGIGIAIGGRLLIALRR
jgi:hypothetical protein